MVADPGIVMIDLLAFSSLQTSQFYLRVEVEKGFVLQLVTESKVHLTNVLSFQNK